MVLTGCLADGSQMKPIEAMYKILNKMIQAAEEGDLDKLDGLSGSYKVLIPNVYDFPMSERDRLFEMCRQSALLAPQFRRIGLEQEYLQNIAEAKKIFLDLKQYLR